MPELDLEGINYSYTEPEPGPVTGAVEVAVLLSEPSTSTVTVEIYSEDITADSGLDYVGFDEVLTFPPGSTRAVLLVTLVGDDIVEGTQRFRVTLRNPVGAQLGTARVGQVTILDIDVYTVHGEHPQGTMEGDEIVLRIFLSHPVEYDFRHIVLTRAWSKGPQNPDPAIPDQDFVGISETVKFEEFEMEHFVRIPTIQDDIKERPEGLFIRIVPNACIPDDCIIALPHADGAPAYIIDDDTPAGMHVTTGDSLSNLNKKVLQVGENSSQDIQIWLTRNPTSDVAVSLAGPGDRSITTDVSSHTFGTDNWWQPFNVQVSAAGDNDAIDGVRKIKFSTTTGDRFYARKNLSYLFAVEKDNANDADGQKSYSRKLFGAADSFEVDVQYMPKRHNQNNFWVFLEFNQPLAMGYRAFLEALKTDGGTVRRVQRVGEGNQVWAVEIKTHHRSWLTALMVDGGLECGEEHAICSRSGEKLSNTLALTVAPPGQEAKLPPGYNGDTPVVTLAAPETVLEGDGHMTVSINLDRPMPGNGSVQLAFFDIEAESYKDYTTSGTVIDVELAQGASTYSHQVQIQDDSIVEKSEKFVVFLTNPINVDLAGPLNYSDPMVVEVKILDND